MISRWDWDKKFAEIEALIQDGAVKNWEKLDKRADELLKALRANLWWFWEQILAEKAAHFERRAAKN